jgi:hypothetical protein
VDEQESRSFPHGDARTLGCFSAAVGNGQIFDCAVTNYKLAERSYDRSSARNNTPKRGLMKNEIEKWDFVIGGWKRVFVNWQALGVTMNWARYEH